jgi:membrane-associated protease RseP (regulator of RpoE activity)
MWFTKQFVGGILFGVAIGMFIGAALAEGKKEINYTSMAGVGIVLVITGVATARAGSPKS